MPSRTAACGSLVVDDDISPEERLTAVAANFPGLIYRRVLHPDGSISYPYLSPGIEDLVGMTPSEGSKIVSLEDIARRIFPEDRDRWMTTIRRSAATLESFRMEGRVIGPDGSTRWVRTAARTHRRADRSIVWDGVVLDVTDLRRAIAEKDALIRERNLLLREVYHRVKNNLQVVDSLLGIQGSRLADAEARSALDDLRRRVHALGLVHQQLMQSRDLATFDIRPFLEELCANLAAFSGAPDRGIAVSVAADSLSIDLDFAIPVGLLVTEFVANALKHGFPGRDKGSIAVALRVPAPDRVIVTVVDDGLGGDARLATTAGTVGWRITQALVSQLDATLEIDRRNGSAVTVSIPYPEGP